MNPLMIASIVGVVGIVGAVVYQNMPEKGDEPPSDESRKESEEDLSDLQEPEKPDAGEPVVPEPGLPPNQPPVEPIPEPPPVIPDRIPPPDKTNVVYDATGKFPLTWEAPRPDLPGGTIQQYNNTQIYEAYRRGDRSFCEHPKLSNFCSSFEAQKGIEERRMQMLDLLQLGVSPSDPRTDLERLLDITNWNGLQQYRDGNVVTPALPFNTLPTKEYYDTQCRNQRIGYDYNDGGRSFRGFSQDECNLLANNYPVRWLPESGGCTLRLTRPDGGSEMGGNFSTGCGPLPKFSDAQ